MNVLSIGGIDMELSKQKIFIPRKKSQDKHCHVEVLKEKENIPVENLLMSMVMRIFIDRRKNMNEST